MRNALWFALGGVAAAITFFGIAPGRLSTAAAEVRPPDTHDETILRFERRLSDSATARGIVLLSPPLQTLSSPPRTVRVLSHHVLVSREGIAADADDARRFEFFGTPLVEADGARICDLGALFTLPREPFEPYARSGTIPRELMREHTRTRCQVRIHPADGLTWGQVARPEHIVVDVLWQDRG